MIIESVDTSRHDDLLAIMDIIEKKSQEYLGATVFASKVITKDDPEMEIKG
jgi:hypothetical protein